MPRLEAISAQIDRLAALEPSPFPVVSLYLNLAADGHGRNHFEPFLKKELEERLRTYELRAPERQSLERDATRIREFVSGLDRTANGLAVFASGGSELFEAVPLAAPLPEHRVFISDQPHLYPLARLLDQYPRYAVLLADTQFARIFVVAANAIEHKQQVEGTKTRRHKMGGWSQARYQRHIDNYHLHHVKEVVDMLQRIVHDEAIASVVVAGDEVVVPLLKDQFTKELSERLVDIVKLDMRAGDREVVETTIAAMREKDRATDRQRVDDVVGAYRAGGLGVVGVEATRRALERGQVDELVIAARPDAINTVESPAGGNGAERTPGERVADELVAKARQTAARVRFIEDGSVAAAIGGVGAMLRFKL